MKPRNDFEKELQQIIDTGKLTPVTPKQMEQARIEMDKNKRQRLFLFNTLQTINGMRLTKCYKVHRYGRGSAFTYFHLCIVHAERDGKDAWAARQCNIGVIDSFSHNGPLTIKDPRFWYSDYIRGNRELRSVGNPYPYSVVHHCYHNDYEFRDSRMETISKSGDNRLLDFVIELRKPLSEYIWSAYKVAKRHDYHFCGEMWKWIRYVELLRINKRDYRNPVIVCPQNLSEAYQRMVDFNDNRLRDLERKRKAEEERIKLKKALECEERYKKEHKKWLGIVIVGSGITIKPLQSVVEFKQEGEAMHHCVYANAYYKQKDSLILSAKDDSGNRLATIEYDLKHKSILQCRAACNKQPERYDEICGLINREMRCF